VAFGWELWAPALPYYTSGDYDKAIEVMTPIVAEHPQYSGLLFNLACLESLAGRPADAIEHLGTAIERHPQFKDMAKTDSDFDPIREEPGFKALVA
jgi:tetratricopeptide (TPR) repeat protein